MQNVIISIIIPVYNAEKYLAKYIDSILEQNFKSYELILIDDGSQDNSPQICEEYTYSNNNIQFIHKNSNGGVSHARNMGIEKANGKYITFIDSDDYVGKNYLLDLYDTFSKIPNENGLAMQGYIRFDETGNKSKEIFETQLYSLDNEKNIFQDLDLHKFGSAWGKLYNLSIIKRYILEFPIGVSYGEDLIFMLNYLTHASFISLSDSAEYYYRSFNTNSLVYNYSTYEQELKGYHLLRQAIKRVKETYKKTDQHLKSYIVGCYIL